MKTIRKAKIDPSPSSDRLFRGIFCSFFSLTPRPIRSFFPIVGSEFIYSECIPSTLCIIQPINCLRTLQNGFLSDFLRIIPSDYQTSDVYLTLNTQSWHMLTFIQLSLMCLRLGKCLKFGNLTVYNPSIIRGSMPRYI